jgi:hypothetical protein
MTIKHPPRPAAHPYRDLDCQLALEPALHAVLDEARAAGWSEQEVVTAAMELTNSWYLHRRQWPPSSERQAPERDP